MSERLRTCLVLLIVLAAIPLARVGAQGAPGLATVVLSPGTGTSSTAQQVQGRSFPPTTSLTLVVLAPDGTESVRHVTSDPAGALSVPLPPPSAGWQLGLYRVAVGLSDGESTSGTFVSGDGKPHLFAEPDLPSPTSAFNLVGIGLPPGQAVDLALQLTGGQDSRQVLHVPVDAGGAFSIFVWPQMFGLPFYAAGNYEVDLPALGLTTPFRVREHPVSAAVTVLEPVPPGGGARLHFQDYRPGRYLWGIYADRSGQTAGEILTGPTDVRGVAEPLLRFARLSPGTYLLATPYEWGETTFLVPAPPSTATPGAATPAPPRCGERQFVDGVRERCVRAAAQSARKPAS